MDRDLSRRDWQMTASGRPFWPLRPRAEDVAIEDIAAHLSNLCRFTGATRSFYSVAEHSVRVAWAVESAGGTPAEVLWALLHDASEAYLHDLPSPLKHQPEMAPYREAERRVQAVICERFGLPLKPPMFVTFYDRVLLRTEQRDLMPPELPGEVRGDAEPLPGFIVPWGPSQARRMFLLTFERLDAATKEAA